MARLSGIDPQNGLCVINIDVRTQLFIWSHIEGDCRCKSNQSRQVMRELHTFSTKVNV